MKLKSIGEIIIDYLNEHGFDGLAGKNCGCSKKDLFVCDCSDFECVPAYHIKSNCLACEHKCDSSDDESNKDCFVSELFPAAERIRHQNV